MNTLMVPSGDSPSHHSSPSAQFFKNWFIFQIQFHSVFVTRTSDHSQWRNLINHRVHLSTQMKRQEKPKVDESFTSSSDYITLELHIIHPPQKLLWKVNFYILAEALHRPEKVLTVFVKQHLKIVTMLREKVCRNENFPWTVTLPIPPTKMFVSSSSILLLCMRFYSSHWKDKKKSAEFETSVMIRKVEKSLQKNFQSENFSLP